MWTTLKIQKLVIIILHKSWDFFDCSLKKLLHFFFSCCTLSLEDAGFVFYQQTYMEKIIGYWFLLSQHPVFLCSVKTILDSLENLEIISWFIFLAKIVYQLELFSLENNFRIKSFQDLIRVEQNQIQQIYIYAVI